MNLQGRNRKCRYCGRPSFSDYRCELCEENIEDACIGCHKWQTHDGYNGEDIPVTILRRTQTTKCWNCGGLIETPSWKHIKVYVLEKLYGFSDETIARALAAQLPSGNCSERYVRKLRFETMLYCSKCSVRLMPPLLHLKVLQLRIHTPMTYREIAEVNNISESRVKKALFELRQKWPDFVPKRLKRQIQQFGYNINYIGPNDSGKVVVGTGRSSIDRQMDDKG